MTVIVTYALAWLATFIAELVYFLVAMPALALLGGFVFVLTTKVWPVADASLEALQERSNRVHLGLHFFLGLSLAAIKLFFGSYVFVLRGSQLDWLFVFVLTLFALRPTPKANSIVANNYKASTIGLVTGLFLLKPVFF